MFTSAVTSDWAEESQGRIEAGAYDLAEPVGPDAVVRLLVALGLSASTGWARQAPRAVLG
ncbi:DUF6183 family protein [Streptomyces sp. NPDC006975]|uniref:DUF6183 family protein n=1 Tax=Streptomyces sp. NPDC006975 TaxID=3154310 RepID=UPI00345403FF